MLTSLIFAGLTMLPPPIEEKASVLEELNQSRGVATIESLDIPWESGDIMEASATPPPKPEPKPEPVVEYSASTPLRTLSEPQGIECNTEQLSSSHLEATGEYSLEDLQFQGVINWNGYKFTFYSQSVLSGGGLNIPGRHINSGGFVVDADGYISLAAAYGIPHGTIFATPFGAPGKVYDTCASCTQNWLDVYTQ